MPAPTVGGMPHHADRLRRAPGIPWRVDSLYDTHPLVTNTGSEALDFVRAFVSAGRRGESHPWGQMLPGETAELCLCAYDIEWTTVTLAWFRPGDGGEFAWSFRPSDPTATTTARE